MVAGGFVGRGPELERARTALRQVRSGTGRLLLVEGEPGIGKTRFLDELLFEGPGDGCDVRRAAADELDRVRPLATIRRVLGKELVIAESATGLHEALVGELEQLGMCAAPATLVVDDVHWADDASIDVVREAIRLSAELPLGLVLAMRQTPRSMALQRAVDELVDRGGARVQLGPLEDGEAVTLVGDGGASLNQLAGGNPFLLLELTRTGWDAAVPLIDGDALADVLRRRWSELPPGTMRVLRVLAILGPGASLLDVASVLGELPSELVDDIEVARRSGLVIDEEGRLRFRHDVLRSAFVAELGPSVRAALHRQAAKSLRANGSPASAVAPHLLAGAQPGDRSAIDDLRTAAHEVERTSLPTAVELLDAAAELAKAEPALATTITAESVPLLTWSGELDEAIARAFRVLNGPLAAEAELEVRRDLAEALALAGRIDEAVQHATAAIATGTAMGPAALELEALSLLAHRFDPLTAMAAGHDLTRRSLEVGAHAAAAMVAYFEALYALDARVLPIALDRSESAVRQARAAAGRELAAGRTAARLIAALEVRGAALNLVDRVAEAEVSLSEARLLATDLGARVILPDLFVGLANCAFERGALDVARAELDAVAELVGDPHVAPLLQLAVSVASGAFDVADELWAALVWHPADRQLATHWWGRRLVFGGRHDEALTLLADEFRRTGQAGETWQARTGSFPLVRLAQRAGDVGLVDALARAAAAAADAARGVLTMQATAELVAAIGREDLPAAQDAVRRFRSAGLPHRTTTAGVELAHLARRVGEPDAARQAAADVAELGARHGLHDAVLASVLLESLSDPARRRPRGVPRATSGWDSLTPTELKVVAEVSRGRTNPQIATELFVSRHTVDSHVKHVFTKLGISSRVELATLAARRGADIP